MRMKERKVNVSWFLTSGYCEYKFYLEIVLGKEAPKTQHMIIGSYIHEMKEKVFLEKAKLMTWKEFLDSEKYAVTKEIFLKKKIGDILLQGKIDEIAIDSKRIQIIDDKSHAFPHLSVKAQIFAYCFLFKENFKPLQKNLIASLRDRDTHTVAWEQEFDKPSEELFSLHFHRIRNILLEKEEPIPTNNPNKCMACQFKDSCIYSLAK